MIDTLDGLQIKEPLTIAGLGSIFWGRSYDSCLVPPGMDTGSFKTTSKLPWVTHYAVPSYGGATFELKLGAPLRTEGFENVMINVDWLMRSVDRTFTRDWDQRARIGDLSIPRHLIECMEKLLLLWHGEYLMIHYCCLLEEGDPTSIIARFSYCGCLPSNPDEVLQLTERKLSESVVA